MSNLVPYRSGILVPHDWQQAGILNVLPGSIAGYEGLAALSITPAALVVSSSEGLVAAISLWSIEDVNVKPFDGIVMEQNTSVGLVLAPPPGGGYGIEIAYSLDMRLKGRWKLMTFFANEAHNWESRIREAAFKAQTDTMQIMKAQTRDRNANE